MLKLTLKRAYRGAKYTVGKLYINGKYFCDTMEDVDRGLSDSMTEAEVAKKKVYGETAIPLGTYRIDMNTVSPKFKNRAWATPYGGKVPRLVNVKGFQGVLIHPLNTAADSLGCIGVGENKVKGKIINSTKWFHALMAELKKQTDITLTITH